MTLLIPAIADELTPIWVTEALRAGGLAVADVTSVETATVGAGSSLISDVSRLDLRYAQDGTGPRTVIADREAVERTLVERYDDRVASLFAFVYPVVAAGAIDRSIAAIMQLDCLDLMAT